MVEGQDCVLPTLASWTAALTKRTRLGDSNEASFPQPTESGAGQEPHGGALAWVTARLQSAAAVSQTTSTLVA